MFKVTNTNTDGVAKDFIGRYDGLDYQFPSPVGGKNQPVYIPDDAAAHIFGVGSYDKTRVLVRHGWATFSSGIAAGMAVLNKFIFEQPEVAYDAPMALISDDHGPAPVVQGAPGEAADDAEPGAVADEATAAPAAAPASSKPSKAAA
jgi:hypothetical protein